MYSLGESQSPHPYAYQHPGEGPASNGYGRLRHLRRLWRSHSLSATVCCPRRCAVHTVPDRTRSTMQTARPFTRLAHSPNSIWAASPSPPLPRSLFLPPSLSSLKKKKKRFPSEKTSIMRSGITAPGTISVHADHFFICTAACCTRAVWSTIVISFLPAPMLYSVNA